MHILKEYNITHVIHFAAQSIVDNSYSNPKKTFDTNINGAINILEILKEINFVKV